MPAFNSMTLDSASLVVSWGHATGSGAAIDPLLDSGSGLSITRARAILMELESLLKRRSIPLFKRLGNTPSCRTYKPKQCGTCDNGQSYSRYASGKSTRATDPVYEQFVGDDLDYAICLNNYFEEGDTIASYAAEVNGRALPVFECNDRLVLWVSDIGLGVNNVCVTVKSSFGRTKLFNLQVKGVAPKAASDCGC